MPITMMLASDFQGAPYLEYATDHRVQSAAQMKLAEHFDLDHVSVISDSAIEAADCGAEMTYHCFATSQGWTGSTSLTLVGVRG
jgi:hypothetical protein